MRKDHPNAPRTAPEARTSRGGRCAPPAGRASERRIACLLAAFVVSLPAVAQEADFAATKGRSAEELLHERLKAAVRTIPGTQTQYLVGGYLQLDAMASRRTQLGDERDTFFASAVPFDANGGDSRLSARQSQINWLSRTRTSAGDVWTRLEANLFPLDGTTAPTLNQLFMRLDDWLIVGKTYSTFMDDGVLPTTLDYNGPGGVTFVRQWLARGSVALGSGWSLQAAVEESQADLNAGGAALSVHVDERRPDLAARMRYEGDSGHLQLSALSRRVAVRVDVPQGTGERRVSGTGLSLSGTLNTPGGGRLAWQLVTGEGVGRYFNDPISATGLAIGADRRLELVRSNGATLYYRHPWSRDWATNIGASTLWTSGGRERPADALHRIVYASANLIHWLSPTLIVGGEVIWGSATKIGGDAASNTRLQVSVRYLVF
jgi:hypothetical protein